jgi:lambda repressor-like predicted transcriptional regulator
MISAELVDASEKRDVSGRKLAGEARRSALLAAYDRSGLTQRAFSVREGVSYHTLVTWLVRRRRERPAAQEKAAVVRFAQVRLPRVRGALEMVLPNGIVIRGADADQVAALVKALGR